MPKFRKKPIIIEAMQLTDGPFGNHHEVAEWCGGIVTVGEDTEIAIEIGTLEGTMRADVGDWIIRGVQGEHYPCKPDIFEATYEPVEDDDATT